MRFVTGRGRRAGSWAGADGLMSNPSKTHQQQADEFPNIITACLTLAYQNPTAMTEKSPAHIEL
jgi:hypothetical protein